MTMKITCPHCGTKIDLAEASADQDYLAIMQIYGTFEPNVAPLVWGYVELFGVLPFGKNLKKLRTLMGDVKKLLDSEAFTYDRQLYHISRKGIVDALNVIIRRHWTSRLKNHNYLKEVMRSAADKEAQTAGKQAEGDLYEKEAAAKMRPAADDEIGAISEEQRRDNLKRVGEIMRGLK